MKRNKNIGFTLIELLVVVGFVALIFGIIFELVRGRTGHGPVHTAPHTFVFEGYGDYRTDTFAEDLSAWLNQHPSYLVTSQNAANFDGRGRPTKYVVTVNEKSPESVEK